MSGGNTSSESNDDEYDKLKSAVDPDFGLTSTNNCKQSQTFTVVEDSTKRKEARQVKSNENREWEAGHFVHPLRLTPDCQKFVAKNLAGYLDEYGSTDITVIINLKFRTIKISKKKRVPQHPVEEADDDGIFLFSSSTERISGKDLSVHHKNNTMKTHKSRHKASVIKKRKIDNSSSEDEDARLKSVAVSAEWVLNPLTL